MDHSVLDSVFAEMAQKPAPAPGDDNSPRVAAAVQPAPPQVAVVRSQPRDNRSAAGGGREAPLPGQTHSGAPSRAWVWLGRAWLAGCLLLAGYFALGALPGSPSRQESPSSRHQPTSQPRTKPIEQLDIFDRVLGMNPLLSDKDRQVPEPEPATWRVLRLRMPKASGKLLQIKLARPLPWIVRVGAGQGKTFFLDLPEMGAIGKAEVLTIEECPPLKPGKGSVVTGTFAHAAEDNLITVQLSGRIAPIGVTDNHPFWSEDRHEFVPVGQLRQSERVRIQSGTAQVVSIAKRPLRPGEMVYNLEVHGEHVYQVTSAGVLVHNSCPADILTPGGKPIGTPGSSPSIREVPGGHKAAEDMFLDLAQGGKDITPPGHPGMVVELPGGGVVGYRPTSTSGPPTIDVNIPSIPGVDKIKFK